MQAVRLRWPVLLVSTPLALALVAGCGRAPAVPGAGVARLPERYDRSVAALGWPGARRSFQVGPGAVVFTGECALEWRLPGGGRCSPVWFERDGVPVAHWTLEDGEAAIEFEAAAVPVPALGDTSLLLSVRATATRLRGTGEVALEMRVRGAPEGPFAVAWDAPARSDHEEAWRGRAALRDGRIVAVADRGAAPPAGAPTPGRPGHASGPGPGTLVARGSARLAAGERRAWDFAVPLYPAGRVPALSHERAVAEARRAWRGWLDRAAALETPDSTLNLAWRAALVTLVLGHERDRGRWVPIGSPFQYRDVWLRDGARVVRALSVAGLRDFALDDARSLARFHLPGGALLSQRGQLDGTGQAAWAFAQAATLAGDAAAARELLPPARDALEWIRRQRGATVALRLPWAGLLPHADPRDGELVRARLVGNDAWAIAGCDAVAALARAAGDLPLAALARSTAAEYRADFRRALASARHPDVPPSWPGPGRDWGNAAAGYPTLALDPSDPRLAALARRLFARGAPSGLVCYGADDSLHTYLGADLAQDALLSDRAAEARAYVSALLLHSSSTLGQAEIVSRAGGFGANLPPHGTAAATIVDLLRNLVVSDLGDTVRIAAGAPLSWWSGTRLERAPTRFGTAGVRLERPGPGALRVRLAPLAAPLLVRVPDGVRAVSAGPGARLEGRWVAAPAGTREITIAVAEVAR